MRIALANLAPPTAEALRRVLALAPEHAIVWAAEDGAEALLRCAADAPDLVLLGLRAPGRDAAEAARRIMASSPARVLVIAEGGMAGRVGAPESAGAGRIDMVDAPSPDPGLLIATGAPLLAKLREIARSRGADRATAAPVVPRPPRAPQGQGQGQGRGLVAIGASAGGPAALAILLGAMPPRFAAPIVIVQHVDDRFVSGLCEWLGQQSALPVRLAREGEVPTAGTVLVAGGDHLVFKSADRLGYLQEPADLPHKPSIDVFFDSVAQRWAGRATGVLLTGMGADGVRGLKAMRDRGQHTIAQNRATSAVYGMPKAAAEADAAVEILPLDAIAGRLVETFGVTTPEMGAAL